MTHTLGEPRRAFRSPDDRLLGGVAAGLAEHLGLRPLQVRIGFMILALAGGFGALVYAGLWVMLPVREEDHAAPGVEAATRQGRRRAGRQPSRRDIGVAVSLVLVGLGVAVLLQVTGLGVSPRVFWPVLVAACGLTLLWWQADESDRAEWLSTTSGWKGWLRVLAGAALVVLAVGLVLFQAGLTGAFGDVILVTVLAVLGVALVFGPWLLRAQQELRRERAERIRSQERADVAAHLHDSVLQTLALIQRQAGDAQTVAQLARTQERELRTWLFDTTDLDAPTLKAALQRAVAEVEDSHHVPIELIVVGDHPADESTGALVAASREAMVNAAKHSGASRIDVYAEVDGQRSEVFVRDRGSGFDLDAVPADRMGVRGSIVDRIARHGGQTSVRTAPGDGTEIRLTMPHRNARQERS